ncbi:hypothetical protein BN8_01194 [Fibrisoma limi BUZ 3]|uniref:Lipoprotein n=1 Tax=Fibrisoma limi BUZ 3 TaxID=1185876 RepID=I2GE87_9BACT|nr:hypothetical protein [Fibrisoma limi]CCH52212.1 hypothetical protein BN8_01194 [Fibrisoma limi BUZ 3]
MKRINILIICLLGVAFVACQDETLPSISADETRKSQLRGTWLPTELTMRYQIGLAPNQRDTAIRLTPTTQPLLVAGRPNPITAFTDTLTFGNAATTGLDTFYLANRGIRQRGYFFVTGATEGGSLLRIGVATRTAGQITRWNYDIVSHGNVSVGANNSASFAPATYQNYAYSIQELNGSRLVLSFQSPTNVANLPQVPITAANQNSTSAWAGRPVLFTATFTKR